MAAFPRPLGFWRYASYALGAIALSGALPTTGHSESVFSSLLGSDDVAVKVTVLSEHFFVFVGGTAPSGIAFSPDGNYLAVNSDYENISIWDWRKNHIVKTVTRPRGFGGSQAADPLSYSPDGHLLANSEGPGEGNVAIRVWETATWKIAQDISDTGPMSNEAMGFTPDSRFLLRLVNRGAKPGDNLILDSVETRQQVWAIQFQGDFDPEALAVSPDGRLAAISGVLVVVPTNVVDIGERVRQIQRHPTINIVDLQQHKIVRVIHGDALGPIAWSPDGTRIAIAGGSYVELFSAQSGERLTHEQLLESTHMNVRFTPDGRYFIETDMNGRGKGLGAMIWDGQHLQLRQRIKGNFNSISVSHDSKYLALGGDGKTTVWQFKAAAGLSH
jgi:WD40 repeat protein